MRQLIIASFILTQALLADQVTLKNGDRLSGNIIKYDGKNLILKSDLAGEVTIPWANVTEVTSTQPLNVTLKDGQRIVGTVTTEGSKFQIATKETGKVTAARDSVEAIRSEPEQKAYDTEIDRYKNPRLIDLWTGTFDLGYAEAHGNVDTETFTLGANAVRATPRDKITVSYTQIYSSSNASGADIATANAKRGGIQYNLNVGPKMFLFGLVDLENDQFQSLDLRFAPAGGAGYHAIKTANTTLDLSLGASMNKEFFSATATTPVGSPSLNQTYAEILVGEAFTHKFTKTVSMNENLQFFPNVSSSGNYRMNFDISAAAAIKKWMSFQISASDRYLSDPLAGRKITIFCSPPGFDLRSRNEGTLRSFADGNGLIALDVGDILAARGCGDLLGFPLGAGFDGTLRRPFLPARRLGTHAQLLAIHRVHLKQTERHFTAQAENLLLTRFDDRPSDRRALRDHHGISDL